MSPNSGVWKGSESEIQRRRESCLWSVCDMNIRRALQPQGNRLSDAHIIPLCGPSLIPVSSTFFTVIPLCLLSSVRAEKEEMHSTHRWLFLSENQINKKRFLWWGCIVVNIMLIWKMFAGLHPGHPSLRIPMSLCAWQGEVSLSSENHRFEYREPLMEKSSDGKWTEGAPSFHHPLPAGKVFHLRQLQQSKALAKTRLQVYCEFPSVNMYSRPALCNSSSKTLLYITMSSDCLLATPCLENESGRI